MHRRRQRRSCPQRYGVEETGWHDDTAFIATDRARPAGAGGWLSGAARTPSSQERKPPAPAILACVFPACRHATGVRNGRPRYAGRCCVRPRSEAGEFAFWWQAHGLKYGISRAADDDIRAGRLSSAMCRARSSATSGALRQRGYRIGDSTGGRCSSPSRRRGRQSDGSIAERVKRNDAFNGFRADYVIETTGAPEAAVKKLLGVIRGFVTAPQRVS